MATVTGRLTSGIDTIFGTSLDDIVEVPSSNTNLSADDLISTGAGHDVLLFERATALGVHYLKLAGLSGIDEFDFTATSSATVTLDASVIDQTDNATLRLTFDADPLALDLRALSPGYGTIEIAGTGKVSLYDADQAVIMAWGVRGTITGGARADTLTGADGNDLLDGADGNDVLEGSWGRDTLLGGTGQDRLFGGLDDDTLDGGDGHDMLTGGTGATRATGGTGSDTFVLSPGESLTIMDFDPADPFERIDLRALPGLSFADLKVSAAGSSSRIALPDGSQITLIGVAAGAVHADMFLFDGDTRTTIAEALSQTPVHEFTADADNFVGDGRDDTFELRGNFAKLAADDQFDGGAGLDVLRIWGADRSLSAARLAGMKGIEIIDLSGATGSLVVEVDKTMIAQSDTGDITVRFAANTLALDSATTTDAAQVILEGTGAVTLRDIPGQKVTISDHYGGTVTGQNKDDVIRGGARDDRIAGSGGNDDLSGSGGNDTIDGGTGDDILSGGTGDDVLSGGGGNDLLLADGGSDTITGGAGNDSFVILQGAGGTVLGDYDTANLNERIDLSALDHLRSFSDLTLTDQAGGVRVTAKGLDLQLQGLRATDLDAGDFLFAGQDPLVFNVGPDTTGAQLQQLIDGAPPGAVINLAAGVYTITETLRINRSDIALRGAGEGKTIFRTEIPDDMAAPTLLVQPDDMLIRLGQIQATATAGTQQLQLDKGHGFQVGDLLYINQANDADWLAATGNSNWEPVGLTPQTAEQFYLREARSRVVAVDGDIVTLADPLPYTFEAGLANVGRNTFLSGVELSGFTIEGRWGTSDPFAFDTILPSWTSIAALELDGVRDSQIHDITLIDPAAHGFKFQRTHEVTGDSLTAYGAINKSGASGYHFLLQESFSTTLSNLSSTDARHALLFSAYSAEHYNNVHFTFTNRDINFHGSPDSFNTVVVDEMVQDYLPGMTPQWQAVNPGVAGLHPNSTIEANDVTFRHARTGERSDRVVAHMDGADIATNKGNDQIIGQGGNDTFAGQDGNDTLWGNGGNDTLSGGLGKDRLYGGAGHDTLSGGDGNDILYGGDGDDVLDGGANGDILYGGAGRDIFLRSYDGLSDIYMDFQTGAGGDIMHVRGTAYSDFSQLILRQQGTDVILDFGPAGFTTFRNVRLEDLVAENFTFETGSLPGQDIALKATEMVAVGTDKGDVFRISRAHIDSPDLTVHGGTGQDSVVITQSSLNANLGKTGDYRGIEIFDISAISTLGLQIDTGIVGQSDTGRLVLRIGDIGKPVLLDVGPLQRGKVLFVEGSREVRLTGGQDHVLKVAGIAGANIIGDDLRDVIHGGKGHDNLFGGAGDDALVGSAGDDTLDGGTGADRLYGGHGSDLFLVDDAGDLVIESRKWAGHDTVISNVDFRMKRAHIEDLELTGTARLGAGNGLRNTITGNDGDNILDGGKNVDTLIGGLGNDIYLLRSPGDTAVERAGEGIDTVRAFGSFTLGANIENLYLQKMISKLGTPVQGLKAIGNTLDNNIVGNPFDNVIIGREGNDTLRGQGGADTFVFDRAPGADNADRIVDFNSTEGDILRLSANIFDSFDRGRLTDGELTYATQAATAGDHLIYDQATGQLWYDADGAGGQAQELIAILLNHATLDAQDILIL